MKNFIIFGVHRKIWVLGEGFTKNQSIEGELPKKCGEGEGGWYSNAHYATIIPIFLALYKT